MVIILGAGVLPTNAQRAADASEIGDSATRSNDDDQPDELQLGLRIGGPSSVAGTTRRDREVEPLAAGYFAFKDRLQKEIGLEYGVDYLPVFQAANRSLGEDSAADGVSRLFGRWELIHRNTVNSGALTAKAEYRHRLGTDVSPQELGPEIGYAGLTVSPFGDFGWTLPNFFWEQHLVRDRVAVVAGIVDLADYVDTYALNDQWTFFLYQAFATDPTIPLPGQGLGFAAGGRFSRHLYLSGGIADANGDPTDPGNSLNSFFDSGEHFTHLELGWYASPEKRYSDNIHLTGWRVDERQQAGVADGWGLAISWNRQFGEKWQPFVRAGFAVDGGAMWDRSLGGGFAYSTRGVKDLLGVGINCSRPSAENFGPGLSKQWTAEIFYRWRPLRMLTISPDLQVLVDPALNPRVGSMLVVGLRVRLAI